MTTNKPSEAWRSKYCSILNALYSKKTISTLNYKEPVTKFAFPTAEDDAPDFFANYSTYFDMFEWCNECKACPHDGISTIKHIGICRDCGTQTTGVIGRWLNGKFVKKESKEVVTQ